MASSFKKEGSRIRLLTIIGMLLMAERGIREVICHAIHHYAKANNKYMKVYDKIKEPSYRKYLNVNNLYGWVMSRKLLVNNFE